MKGSAQKSRGVAARRVWRAFRPWLGPVVVFVALACALTTFLFMAEFSPLAPASDTLIALYVADGLALVALAGMVVRQSFNLFKAWRRGEAAARLHVRTVAFFSVVALAPALVLAVVGSVSLNRALNPAFMANVKGFVHNTAEAAQVLLGTQCGALLQETQLTASDLDDAAGLFYLDQARFHQYFAKRAHFLDFAVAALIKPNGQILDRVDVPNAPAAVITELPPSEFESASQNGDNCVYLDELNIFVALRPLHAMSDTYLYVTRPIHPFAVEFPKQAQALISNYDAFETFGASVKRAFATMYALLTTIMLLAAIWFGLDFANRLVASDPPPHRGDGSGQPRRPYGARRRRSLARRSRAAWRGLQQDDDRTRSAAKAPDRGEPRQRRAARIHRGRSRRRAGGGDRRRRRRRGQCRQSFGAGLAAVRGAQEPRRATHRGCGAGAAPILADARDDFSARTAEPAHHQTRDERAHLQCARDFGASARQASRISSSRSTTSPISSAAQRTAAWADVARRIAHEIKNPLTPIQLSAERLKRKYGRLITQDRDVFDQCTDTIVRQVDDIKRMVDEFSSFARMPKARLAARRSLRMRAAGGCS